MTQGHEQQSHAHQEQSWTLLNSHEQRRQLIQNKYDRAVTYLQLVDTENDNQPLADN